MSYKNKFTKVVDGVKYIFTSSPHCGDVVHVSNISIDDAIENFFTTTYYNKYILRDIEKDDFLKYYTGSIRDRGKWAYAITLV